MSEESGAGDNLSAPEDDPITAEVFVVVAAEAEEEDDEDDDDGHDDEGSKRDVHFKRDGRKKRSRAQDQSTISRPLKRIHRIGVGMNEPGPIEEEGEVSAYDPPPGPIEHTSGPFKDAIGNFFFIMLLLSYSCPIRAHVLTRFRHTAIGDQRLAALTREAYLAQQGTSTQGELLFVSDPITETSGLNSNECCRYCHWSARPRTTSLRGRSADSSGDAGTARGTAI